MEHVCKCSKEGTIKLSRNGFATWHCIDCYKAIEEARGPSEMKKPVREYIP